MIQIDSTPNPNTKKFSPGTPLWEHDPLDLTPQTRDVSPLADLLFDKGATRVLLAFDSLSITKSDEDSWQNLEPSILFIIDTYIKSAQPLVTGDIAKNHVIADAADKDIVAEIETLLATRVRPAVAQDGGDITLHGFKDGVVYLTMKGACAGCPSSTMTLKMGIENLLRHYFPDVLRVESV